MPEEGIRKIPQTEMLRHEEILQIVRALAELGIKKVRLTGGEPLIRREICTLIKNIKAVDGIQRVAITTNGVLLDSMADDLLDAGLDELNVSLDTLQEAKFYEISRREALPKVLKGIEKMYNTNKVTIKLNCVPILGVNSDEVANIAALAKDKRIKVRYIELMPIGCAYESGYRGMKMNAVQKAIESVHGKLTAVPNSTKILGGPARYYTLQGFTGQIGFIDALDHKFCDKCNRIRLTSEGFLKLCLNSNEGVDLRKPLREGINHLDLVELLKNTIWHKPQEHFFMKSDNDKKDIRHMYQVGG